MLCQYALIMEPLESSSTLTLQLTKTKPALVILLFISEIRCFLKTETLSYIKLVLKVSEVFKKCSKKFQRKIMLRHTLYYLNRNISTIPCLG